MTDDTKLHQWNAAQKAKLPASEVQIDGDHYLCMAIQPMEFSLTNNLDAATHSVIKYLTRKKGGAAGRTKDLRKAIHCIQLLAEHEGLEL